MSESDESGTESTEADEVAETKERGIKRAHVDAKLSALHNLLGDQPGTATNLFFSVSFFLDKKFMNLTKRKIDNLKN